PPILNDVQQVGDVDKAIAVPIAGSIEFGDPPLPAMGTKSTADDRATVIRDCRGPLHRPALGISVAMSDHVRLQVARNTGSTTSPRVQAVIPTHEVAIDRDIFDISNVIGALVCDQHDAGLLSPVEERVAGAG